MGLFQGFLVGNTGTGDFIFREQGIIIVELFSGNKGGPD